MSDMKVVSGAKEATIEAVIIRADGTVEQLGVISYWHKNPLKRLAWRMKQAAKSLTRRK